MVAVTDGEARPGEFLHALDLDSHEMMPSHICGEVFGDIGRDIMNIIDSIYNKGGERKENDPYRPDITGDVAEIDPATVWRLKGPSAPGAIDMHRRSEVLDAMGVERQLVFPGFGFSGLFIASLSDRGFDTRFTVPRPPNHRELGFKAVAAHNDWTLTLGDLRERQRHVAIIPTFDFDAMMDEAERMAVGGAQALWISATSPPAGTSPANTMLDPFWSLAEEQDIPVVLHLNTDLFLPAEWWDAPEFLRQCDSVLPMGTFFMTTFHLAVENFLAAMVIGGVFDRHPRLRLGIIECGAQWLGPLCERMELLWDEWHETRKLSRRPTDYVVDQVRVTPFYYEPIDVHLNRFPRLADVYCFSSDYPHSEGGYTAMADHLARLAPLGSDVVNKFFRHNAELLIPA